LNVRERAISKLGGTCRSCFTKDDLQLHHIVYQALSVRGYVKSDYGKRAREAFEHPERFELLCKKCHLAFHHNKVPIKTALFHLNSNIIDARTLTLEQKNQMGLT